MSEARSLETVNASLSPEMVFWNRNVGPCVLKCIYAAFHYTI